jgi:hypothetical protein
MACDVEIHVQFVRGQHRRSRPRWPQDEKGSADKENHPGLDHL